MKETMYKYNWMKSSALNTALLPKDEYISFNIPASFSSTDLYTVTRDDNTSLFSFALHHNIDANELMSLNNLDRMDELYEGQQLRLPQM